MIWRDGTLPPQAPNYQPQLTEDLLSYAYSLLLQGLRYLDLGGEDALLVRTAFERAGEALEAAVARGEENAERDFHRLMAASCYHLGRFSARAYSLLHIGIADANLTLTERSLAKLMLRDLNGLTNDLAEWLHAGNGSDESLFSAVGRRASVQTTDVDSGDEEESGLLTAVGEALDRNFMSAVATAMLALERGEQELVRLAVAQLRRGLEGAAELNMVARWWCHRIAIHLLRGLWDTSFHHVLPLVGPPDSGADDWTHLRSLFISSLYVRGKSEVELWPSQMDAARRVLDFQSNLVLSLPTSAGKTRIAELCILACLAKKRRIVFVTPLRALSAQTEVTLQRTFQPLGKTVSSLYGSIGASGADVDALRSRDIIVATPEKLDFALRSDPTLLDDVGLVVLDEGHMIGLNEREVRYEAQIQRLLKRPDAAGRRIVCLSAILPDGDQLEDFVAWLTVDKPDGLIRDKWRPTRLRFGEVNWQGAQAMLTVTVGDEKPFIPRFLTSRKPTKGRAKKGFPSDQRELCLATAWRLVEDGQTVLIFCPLRKSVLPFAQCIVDMHARGHLASVLGQPESILQSAMTVGTEWFGSDHVLLKCLRLGVAIHHGQLPTPYRKEIERLLRDGVLKVTVSSPTLAQGLNLSATSLVFHGLYRSGKLIDISEFRNVVGRAGRAYIDIEGLVLYPMFDEHRKRRSSWQSLIDEQAGREMESGLLRLVLTLLERMALKVETRNVEQLLAYVAGEAAWGFPEVVGESAETAETEKSAWQRYMTSLDTALLSLLGDNAVADDQIEVRLDEILASSLFTRRLARRKEATSKAISGALKARAKYIWSHTTSTQRRGYFLAGVGLETGQQLDARSAELEELLLRANVAIEAGEHDLAVEAITAFAEIAFTIEPFTPNDLIADWKRTLRLWLQGLPLQELMLDDADATISFIEQAFIYNLPWAMEAVRVRASAHADMFSDELQLSDYPMGHAVSALETGTLSVPAALLIQAGFASRIAAIKAVADGTGQFDSMAGLTAWLASDVVNRLSANVEWPTKESRPLWVEFVASFERRTTKTWQHFVQPSGVRWLGAPPPPGQALRLGGPVGLERAVMTADFRVVGELPWTVNPRRTGLLVATSSGSADRFDLQYFGPPDAAL